MTGHRGGFTLVELLVVVAIAVVLLALLSPALEKAIDSAEKAKCLANQRVIVQASHMYATHYARRLPPWRMAGRQSSGYDWRDISRWYITSTADPKEPMGLGLLPGEGLLPTTNLGRVIHCPSLDNSAADGWANIGMDRLWQGLGAGGSWWWDPAYTGHRILGSYNYREPSYELAGKGTLKLANAGPRFVLSVDLPDLRFGGRFSHPEGYNRVFGDGHGGFLSDPERVIDGVIRDGTENNGYFDGTFYPFTEERVYEEYLSSDSRPER